MSPPYDDDDDDLDRTHLGVEAYKNESVRPSERDRAYLIVLVGANVGEMYPVDVAETVIGRAETATIKLTDDGISRKHARISAHGKDVRIEDLGSSNGTLVNGNRVTTTTVLKDGDKIELGSTTILKFTYHDKLEESFQRQMYTAALRDHLTQTFNKKHFLDRLGAELAFARRHNAPLALIMFDLDHFKLVNDTHGHLAGDQVLAKLAQAVQSVLRTEDTFARYGGEEFAILCRGSGSSLAAVVAERIRSTVAQAPVVAAERSIPVTVSLGVAAYPEIDAVTPSDLIAAADAALYEAKRSGRNRVVTKP